MVTYLDVNGFTWNCGDVEETAMVLRAAAGHMKEGEWEARVVRNVGEEGVGGARELDLARYNHGACPQHFRRPL